MKHLNDNLICTIDINTNGPMPCFHDLIEIAIVPLVGLNVNKAIAPFHVYMQLRRGNLFVGRKPPLIDLSLALDPYDAAALFEKWYDQLGLRHHKRIEILSYCWAMKVPFIIDWLGVDENANAIYTEFFAPKCVRDISCLLQYWNDFAYVKSEHIPFTKQRLHFLAQKLGVPWPGKGSALSNCMIITEIYKKLLQLRLPAGIDLPFNFPTPIDYTPIDCVTPIEDDEDEL